MNDFQNSVSELFDFLDKNYEKDFIILTHNDPDGDAIGAAFSIKKIFEYLNLKSEIILSNYNFPNFLIEEFSNHYIYKDGNIFLFDILNFNNYYKKIDLSLKDLLLNKKIIVVDSSNLKRIFTDFEKIFTQNELNKIEENLFLNIDHHFDNKINAKYNFVDSSLSSSCEIILNIFLSLRNIKKNTLNDKIFFTYLLLGIVYDSYCFQNANTTYVTFNNASFLIQNGADYEKAKSLVLKNNDIKIFKLWGKILQDLEDFNNGSIVLAKISYDFIKKEKINPNILTTGFINHLNSIKKTDAVIFILEKENEIKGSIRSNNNFAFKFASIFEGGGHPNAAGFIIKKDSNFFIKYNNFENFIDKLREIISNFN
jgi:phosphoesterase RecJ-like protein